MNTVRYCNMNMLCCLTCVNQTLSISFDLTFSLCLFYELEEMFRLSGLLFSD